jgi:hypothetical protein
MKSVEMFLVLILIFESNQGHVAIYGGKTRHFKKPNYSNEPAEPQEPYYVAFNIDSSSYGSSFGKNRLPTGTHIYNNEFIDHRFDRKPFLTEKLYKYENDEGIKSELRGWNAHFDKRWRKTTKMPYFANELPSEETTLTASVVVGNLRLQP